jgi:tetratricopeptide (TPR) repeat protein
MILLLLFAQAATPSGPPAPVADRYERCLDRAKSDPTAAEAEAGQWQLAGGSFFASQCLGMAYSNEARWSAAAASFESAARAAEKAGDTRGANYWAQAGNAWLAAGDASKARSALDAAISAGTLTGQPLGEAHLDRARAMVAGDDPEGAREDLDRALGEVPADPLAWLLSATLARREQQVVRAKTDIAGCQGGVATSRYASARQRSGQGGGSGARAIQGRFLIPYTFPGDGGGAVLFGTLSGRKAKTGATNEIPPHDDSRDRS